MNDQLKDQYPSLFCKQTWGPVVAEFSASVNYREEQISNVSLIPFVDDRLYVMMQLENGFWELPGGTLEPQETYHEALKREAREELGAEILSFTIFGQMLCNSSAAKPYRPHIPHPNFTRLIGYGHVKLTGLPTNPEGGEKVVQVDLVPIEEVVARFEAINRGELADLYRMAHQLRLKE